MSTDDHNGPDWRNRVIVFLAFLTSPECLAACKHHAVPEKLAAALTRIWFDRIFVPGETYVDSLKGGVGEDQVAAFNAHFTEAELKTLARFHGFFELRIDFMVNSMAGRGFFPENDSWQSILRHASHVLSELDPEPELIRSALASLVKQPTKGLLDRLQD